MSNNFIIIAHRGESHEAPENTLAAINLAWERNDDGVEIDIRLSKDDKIIVIHDRSTSRTGGKFYYVNKYNYSELKTLDVGSYKNIKFEGEHIPLLKTVIEGLPEKKYLFIEIKSNIETVNILETFFNSNSVNPEFIKFISFNKNLLKQLKEKLPSFEMFWIIDDKIPLFKKNFNEIIKQCIASGLNGLDLDEKMITSKNVIDKCHDANLKIYTWTVNDVKRAKELMNWGIDGITSDRASWLSEQIKS